MRNIKLTIEYDGTNYCGWQVQDSRWSLVAGRWSIQETIEKVLRKILQEKVKLIGSGRTDAGVHALAQVANFKTNKNISIDKLRLALNGNLPEDIVITGIEEVEPDFHSRYDAKTKTYCYFILNRIYPSASLRKRVYFYSYPLDIRLMRQASKYLLGKHDFKSFCASGSRVKDTIRTIKRIAINKKPCILYSGSSSISLIHIGVEADGFLYNMVRNIVGTLIEVGRGKFSAGSLKRILLAKNRKLAGPTAPACGLCLIDVKY